VPLLGPLLKLNGLTAKEVMDAFSSLQYPHWLIIAGAIVLLLGLLGLAFRPRNGQTEIEESAVEDKPWLLDPEAAEAAADREAILEENKRIRWARRDSA
jgi:hypothetical protein